MSNLMPPPTRGCYCSERANNLKFAESLKDVPEGFCGICDVCGKPGHTSAHPTLPTTGSWCDAHWAELLTKKSVTMQQVVRAVMLLAMAGIAVFFIFRLIG